MLRGGQGTRSWGGRLLSDVPPLTKGLRRYSLVLSP